jgi:hypothetical protein
MDPAVAALVGALIGLTGAIVINVSQRRWTMETERHRAFAGYLGALYPVIAELQGMPPNPTPDLIERISDRLRGEAATYLRTRREVAALGATQFVRQDRLSAAVARVQLLEMPLRVVRAFERANAYVEQLGEDRTEALKSEWNPILAELHAASELLEPRIAPRWLTAWRK